MLVAEECVDTGCVGRQILSELAVQGRPCARPVLANLGDRFVQHGKVSQLRALCGIDGQSLCKRAMEAMANG